MKISTVNYPAVTSPPQRQKELPSRSQDEVKLSGGSEMGSQIGRTFLVAGLTGVSLLGAGVGGGAWLGAHLASAHPILAGVVGGVAGGGLGCLATYLALSKML